MSSVWNWSEGCIRLEAPKPEVTFEVGHWSGTMSLQKAYEFYLTLKAVFAWLRVVSPGCIADWED